jgi:hypothetical protein
MARRAKAEAASQFFGNITPQNFTLIKNEKQFPHSISIL